MSTAVVERSGVYGDALNVEQALIGLMRYGQPRLGVYGEGWHAHIEMNTQVTGGKFEIRSDFKHASPSAAIRQLLDRVEAAVRK